MARVETSTHIEATPARVWHVLTDWEDQARWMQDARRVEVTSSHREGLEVAVRCETDIAMGLVVTDEMVVTEWVEPEVIAVRHVGWPIRGVGAFELMPTAHGTHFTWWEEIAVPFGSPGEALAQVLVVPWITRVFRASLAGLKRVCESTSVRP